MVVEFTLAEISTNWKKALYLTDQVSTAASQLEKAVNSYLRKDCNPNKLPLLQVLTASCACIIAYIYIIVL